MMSVYKIVPEEHPCTIEQIQEIERICKVVLPDDYKEFMMQYNGGLVFPNTPKSKDSEVFIFPIERFFSIGDIKMISISKRSELRDLIREDYNDHLLDLDPDKLVFIAHCERGNLVIYCGDNDYGRICFVNYSGGEGVEKTHYTSIFPLLNDLRDLDDEYTVDLSKIDPVTYKSTKVYEMTSYFFYTDQHERSAAIQRFQEVLNYYGDPNVAHPQKEMDVVEAYVNYPTALEYLYSQGAKLPQKLQKVHNLESLKFLISKGIDPKGLLVSTRKLEIVKFLVEECGHDLNEPFEGKYPILEYSRVYNADSVFFRHQKYVFVKGVIDLGFDLDLNVIDIDGQTVHDRLSILKESHDKYIAKYGSR